MDNKYFEVGKPWLDAEGNIIQAHGGGVLYHDGLYYWYGENKEADTYEYLNKKKDGTQRLVARTDVVGVSCYSSKDLLNWKNEGVVLESVNESTHDLYVKNVLERPKVVYNDTTKKYVMWMHIDTANYQYARAGVAISDSPTGPFEYLYSIRPNEAMSRDITLFKDEDNKAYLIFSSENNSTMYISQLTEDYLKVEGVHTRNFINKFREAPAIFKYQKKYYLITSGCTGWDPNEAECAVSEHILGEWKVVGNPCIGEYKDITFNAQSTYVFKVEGTDDRFIFMADRWNKEELRDSRYVWLPLSIEDENVIIEWNEQWKL